MAQQNGLFNVKGMLFSYYAIQAILLPYLPSYFSEQGYSAVQIGWLMNIGPFMAMFAQPVWGVVSDRYRSLKMIIIMLWGLTVCSSIGLFAQVNFTWAFVFVMLLYFFMYPTVPLLDNLVVRTVSTSGGNYGSVRLWGSIGFCSVALISGYALESIGGVGNIKYLFWGLWILPFLLIIGLKDRPSQDQRPMQLKDMATLFRNRKLLWFLLLVLIVCIPLRMNDVMLSLVLSDLGTTEKGIGIAWFFAAASEIPTFALLGLFIYRFNEMAVMALSAFLFTIRWLLYGFIDTPEILIGLQATHSITFAMFWVAAVQYLVRLIPAEFGSTGQALMSSIFLGLAGIVGGIGGGWIMDVWGKGAMYYAGAGVCLIACLLMLGTQLYGKRQV